MDRVLKPMLISLILLLSVFLLMGCRQEIQITDSSIVTRTGTVTDLAMGTPLLPDNLQDESCPYVGIRFEDGTGICIWNKCGVDSSGIKNGDTVEITYGLQESTGHWILIEIKELS